MSSARLGIAALIATPVSLGGLRHFSVRAALSPPSLLRPAGAVVLQQIGHPPRSHCRHVTAMAAPDDGSRVSEEPSGMEDAAQLLRELAEVPGISAAWIGPDSTSITVQYVQRDLGSNRVRKSLRTLHLPPLEQLKGEPLPVQPSFPVELNDAVLHSVSPSGRRQLVARKVGDALSLELWEGSRVVLERSIPRELHGPMYSDNWFGAGAAWSPDEQRIAYVAEAPAPVRTPDWGAGQSAAKPAGSSPQAAPKSWRGHGEFQEDWGERNTGKRPPALFVLEAVGGGVARVGGLPADSSVGQPVWEPDGQGLVCVCWPHAAANFPGLPQRLGIVYCLNRPSHLRRVLVPRLGADADKPPASVAIETGLPSALCPRFSPGGGSLVFLAHAAAVASGAHCASATLELLAWPPPDTGEAERQTLIGTVARPADRRLFPGLYSFQPGAVPFAFVSDGRLLITSHWRSARRILDVRWEEGGEGPAEVREVTPADGPAPAWTLLAANSDLAVAAYSGPGSVPVLAVAPLKGSGSPTWTPLQPRERPFSAAVAAWLDPARGAAYHVLQVQPTTPPEGLEAELILIPGLGERKAKPSVLVPHGGPHAAFAAEWTLSSAFLAIRGFNVIQVNFRGSLGYGEDSVQSLPSRIGETDVADCVAALDLAAAEGWVEGDRVAVVGGSHGGFLAGHLLGQHPGRFAAGVLRNPVLDLALMTQISDIPDWCFVEAFGSQEGLKRAAVKPTAEELAVLTDKSPIRYVNSIRAPMIFMLGAKDRRVVMRDAQQYVATLKARKDAPETRTIVFPEDSHALELPQTEFEQWLNAAWWLQRFV